ncbi:replication-associated recombination protein A [Candidatus Kaiserbacteria bacterium]|nr:replication-associated recombination protein A [Candidatus Kaiserbacteria bacterium]
MEPLASKIRPTTLDEFVGQEHLTGPGKPVRVATEKKELFSFILWGPPGSGKTTLARIYANALDAEFHEVSAVEAGKDDIKKIIPKRGTLAILKPVILFVDEIHRFNKAQQDFLLPFVERGDLTLIGATTENPSFEVIAPLLSRCRVFVLNEHSEKEMEKIIAYAAKKISAKGGSASGGKIPKDARDWLIAMAQGDARQAITVLETAKKLYGEISIESLKDAIQSKHLRYDKKGEEHYNIISAFIKSMRASQPDAALYYLARMVKAGEDPKFIARRMVVFASEDIGLGTPTALVVANAVFRACETIGYPECAINLAHGVAYLANAEKSRASYDAYQEAVSDVEEHGNLPIPMKVRNAPTKLMKELGYHKGYTLYDKDSYLPDKIKKNKYLKGEKN